MLYAHSFNRHFPYLLAPDGGGDGGGNPPTGGGTAAGNGDLENRLLAAFNSIVQKQGGHDAAGILLLQENKGYREEINKLKADLAAAQGKVPGEGAVVLDSEQAAVWSAYQELGKPDELKQLQGDYTRLQRDRLFQQAAAAHGYKAAVLGQLPGVSEYQIEVKEQEKDGKKVKVAIAKNGDGQERPLPELIEEKWADFKPALLQQPAAPSGTPWPPQDVSSQGAETSITNSYLERQREARKDRKNPITGE